MVYGAVGTRLRIGDSEGVAGAVGLAGWSATGASEELVEHDEAGIGQHRGPGGGIVGVLGQAAAQLQHVRGPH